MSQNIALCAFVYAARYDSSCRCSGGRAGAWGSLPDSATLEICTPCSVAMKPRMEKTTKPAKKLVPLLMSARMMASLGAEGTVWAGETACCPRAGRAGVAGL